MPIPNEYLEVIEMLSEATQEGRVRWKQTGSGTIGVSVPPSEFEVWAGIDDETERGFVAFGLREARTMVDNWHVDEGDTDYERMRVFHQSAKRQAFGLSKKLKGLKDLLAKKGPVGGDDEIEF